MSRRPPPKGRLRPPPPGKKGARTKGKKGRKATMSVFQLVTELLNPDRGGPALADAEARGHVLGRGRLIGGVIGLCYLGLVAQAGHIMLFSDEQLGSAARQQFEEAVEVTGRRGDILARDGSLLATSADLAAVHANPLRMEPYLDEMIAGLAPLISLSEEELRVRLQENIRKQNIELERDLLPVEGLAVTNWIQDFADTHDWQLRNVVWVEDEPRRFYPGKSDAATVVGVVSRSGVGAAGIERTMDRALRGDVHKYVRWRDRKNRHITANMPEAAPGDTVVLTLDRRLQHVAEEALEQAITETGAEAAWAVVMDVQTGEILVLANRPTQNPNDTASLRMESFKNRAALDAYEPGSVFKPFIAAAALEEGLYLPESLINCEGGSWVVGGRVIHDDHPKGVISVSEVIKYSSNIGAVKLAFKLGADRSLRYLSELGFGRETGLELPGETRGVLRSPDHIKPIELATTSYGHGVSVNAIQLVAAMATLGNGGVRMEPMLIKELRDPSGRVLEQFDPRVDRRIFSPETTRATIDMMVTVTERGGTGTRARVKHENGSYSATDRIGSFVGLIPADAPRFAIVVTVDTPTVGLSYGGVVAGPAFSTIAGEAMRLYNIPPNPELLEPDPPPVAQAPKPPPPPPVVLLPEAPPERVWTPEGELLTPDLTGLSLRDALATVQGSGLQVAMHGSGRIIQQIPAPGTALRPGDAINVTLQ